MVFRGNFEHHNCKNKKIYLPTIYIIIKVFTTLKTFNRNASTISSLLNSYNEGGVGSVVPYDLTYYSTTEQNYKLNGQPKTLPSMC